LRLLHLGEEVSGFVNLLDKLGVVHEVHLGLFEGEIDEHTSDLGGKRLSSELSNEIEDSVTNVLFEMRVISLDRGNNLVSLGVESSGGGVLSLGHLDGSLSTNGGHGESRHGHLLLTLSSVSSHVLLHVVSSLHVVVHATILSLSVLAVRSVSLSLEVTTSVVVSLSTLVVLLSLERVHALSLHGEGLEELSDLVVELVSGGDVLPVVVLVVELLELLESKFILGLFVLDVSEFLKLVMADLELSLVEESVVAVLESLLGLVGSLEADESVSLLLFVNGEHLDALNFSVFLEDSSEVFFGELGVKVLNVKVASLLGVLVLDGLSEELFLSLGGSKSGLNVEDLTVTHVATVKLLNGFGGLLRSVLVIVFVFTHVADESESSVSMRHLAERGNVSEG